MFSIIVLTYRRINELRRCINSISTSAVLSNSSLRLSVFNNDPENSINEQLFNIDKSIVQLSIVNRPENIGPRQNFYESVVFELSNSSSDYFLFLSDDDYLLPDFISIFESHLELSPDALMSSAAVVPENLNIDCSYSSTKFTYSVRPTRPWRDSKVQFMTDSRLFSGTVYSRDVLKRFIDYCTESVTNKSRYLQYWYPMVFIASYAENCIYMRSNLLVHTQNNLTHWGEIDFLQEFFYNRIDMFHECYKVKNISFSQYICLVADFLAFQSFNRQFLFLFDKRFRFIFVFPWFSKLLRVLFIHKPARLFFQFSKRVLHYSNYLIKI